MGLGAADMMALGALENAPPPRDLSAGKIHVWFSNLRQDIGSSRQWDVLSDDERVRADRFRFEKDRAEYVCGRAQLRRILAECLGAFPQELSFCYGPMGKPELAGPFAASGLRFNLSHSGGVAVYAISHDREVGVDLEKIHELPDVEQVARRFFSARENATLQNLPAEQKLHGFFNCWTRKEALVKGLGDGLSRRLDCFTVSLAPGEPARLLDREKEVAALDGWALRTLTPAPGFAAALAAEGRDWQSVCREWTE